jgi:hypothetical protein
MMPALTGVVGSTIGGSLAKPADGSTPANFTPTGPMGGALAPLASRLLGRTRKGAASTMGATAAAAAGVAAPAAKAAGMSPRFNLKPTVGSVDGERVY